MRLARFSIMTDANGYVTRANGDLFALTGNAMSAKAPAALLPALRIATKLPTLALLAANATQEPTLPFARAEPLVWTLPSPRVGQPGSETPVLTQPFLVVLPTKSQRWYLHPTTGAVVATEDLTLTCFRPQPAPLPATVPTYHHGKRPVFLSEDAGLGNTRIFRLADSSEVPTVAVIRGMITPTPEYTKDSTFADPATRLRGDWDVLYGLRVTARYFKEQGIKYLDIII